MHPELPTYNLRAFPHHEPEAPFYMTRLEELVRDFKGIDRSHSHTFYLLMWIVEGSGKHTIDFRTYDVGPRQLYFLTPGQVHSWELSADIRGYNLFFETGYFRSRFSSRLFSYPFFHSHQHRPLLDMPDLAFETLYDLAFAEYRSPRSPAAEVFLSYLQYHPRKSEPDLSANLAGRGDAVIRPSPAVRRTPRTAVSDGPGSEDLCRSAPTSRRITSTTFAKNYWEKRPASCCTTGS